jgi:phosphoglycolate phosphatase-like HAD superfamily hydrolase
MKPIYVFDLDDTLLESSERFDKAILCILDEEGIAYDAQAVTATILPIGLERTADYFQKVLGVSGSTDEIKRRINEKQLKLYRDVFELKPGVRAYLEGLVRTGARLFILTATPKRLAVPALQHNEILDLFEAVWSTEEDFGLNKDNVRLFEAVAERVATQPSLIRYFDDSVTAVTNAKQAGFDTYFFYFGQKGIDPEEMRLRGHAILESFEAM